MAWSPQLLGQQENWMANSNSPMLQQYGQMQQFQQNYNNPAAEWNKYTSGLRDMGFNEVRDLRASGYTNTQSNSNQKNFDWSQAGDYLKGGSNLATAAFQDITDILGNSKSQITQKPTYDLSHVNSFDDLNNTSFTFADSNQLTRPTFGSSFMDINMRTARGAMAGSALGPWGMLGGAIGGTLSGVANSITKAVTYKKDLNRLNTMNANMMQNYNKDFAQAFNNINNNQQMNLDMQRSRRLFAEGGQLNTTINTGGTHEQNPYGGVQMGIAPDGQPNLVEEGEVVYDDYVYPSRVKANPDILKQFNIYFRNNNKTYADIANQILKLHRDADHDVFHKQTQDKQFDRLRQALEYQKIKEVADQYGVTPEEYLAQQQKQQMLTMQQQPMQTDNISDDQMSEEMPMDQTDMNIQQPNMFKKGGPLPSSKYAHHPSDSHAHNKLVKHYYDEYPEQAMLLDRWGYIYSNATSNNTDNHNLKVNPKEKYTVSQLVNDRGAQQAIIKLLQTDPKAQAYLQARYGWNGQYLNAMIGMLNTTLPKNQQIHSAYHDDFKTRLSNPSNHDDFKTRLSNPSNFSGLQFTYSENPDVSFPRSTFAFTDYVPQYQAAKPMSITTNETPTVKRPSGGGYVPKTPQSTTDAPKEETPIVTPELESKAPEPEPIPEKTNPDNTQPALNIEQNDNSINPFEAFWGANNPLRYAPVFDNMRSLLTQNKPDMTYSNQLASLYKPLTYNPTGQRMYYNPVDQYYLANQAQQARNTQLAAARNNANTAQANAYYQSMANQQMNNLIADNYIKALQQNDQMRNTTLQYNNQLDAQNETNRLNVQAQNASNYAQIMGNSYQAAEEERLAVENAREANKQNMAMNLGAIGKEQSDYWNVGHNPALLYGAFGTNYKGYANNQSNNINNFNLTGFNQYFNSMTPEQQASFMQQYGYNKQS